MTKAVTATSLIYYTSRAYKYENEQMVHNNYGDDNIYKTICNKKYCCAIIVESSHA